MEHRLDVSDLPAPEPLEAILAELPQLEAGDYLRVQHRREPFPLYKLLEQDGFAWSSGLDADFNFVLLIWRAEDEAARRAVLLGLG